MLTLATTAVAEAPSHQETGIGAIGLDGSALLFQLINFLVLLFVLQHFAYKPILRVLRRRREIVAESLASARTIAQAKETTTAEQAQLLATARREAAQIVTQGKSQAESIVETAEEAARTRAEALVAEARAGLRHEEAQLRATLKHDMAALVVAATEKVLGEKLDAKADHALITRALRDA